MAGALDLAGELGSELVGVLALAMEKAAETGQVMAMKVAVVMAAALV